MRKLLLGLLLASSFGCGSAAKDHIAPASDDAVDREIAALSVAVLKKERGRPAR